jgi:phosphatidylinositol-3-phosphatase
VWQSTSCEVEHNIAVRLPFWSAASLAGANHRALANPSSGLKTQGLRPHNSLMPPLDRPCRAFFAALILLCGAFTAVGAAVPHHDRVVVVIMENKSYDQVRTQPYTASLISAGAVFTQSFATTHPSQSNYLALWAASILGVTTNNCPAPGSPFSAENLGHSCETAGLTWRAYSENLAVAGSAACSYDGNATSGLYTRKHDPWTNFGNLDHARERPYADLAADIAGGTLPKLVFVIPNNCHNTHNSSTPGCGVPDGDAWLAANLPAIRGALGPNGLLILTWDEDDNFAGNHILTVFAGPQVLPGAVSNRTITHYTVVRTICDALGLTPFAGAAAETPIDGVWLAATDARRPSWGRIKLIYR